MSNYANEVIMPKLSDSVCSFHWQLIDTQFCAGHDNENKGVCEVHFKYIYFIINSFHLDDGK